MHEAPELALLFGSGDPLAVDLHHRAVADNTIVMSQAADENWLPSDRTPRVAFERMLIRGFATVLENKGGIRWIEIGGCGAANDRIDR